MAIASACSLISVPSGPVTVMPLTTSVHPSTITGVVYSRISPSVCAEKPSWTKTSTEGFAARTARSPPVWS